jgi:hypothetical protein
MGLQNYTQVIDGIRVKRKTSDIPAENQITVFDDYNVNENMVLRYISVCTPDFMKCGGDGNVYSALIILNEDGVDTETSFIYDISRNSEEAFRIMHLLSDNGVTPDTAAEIIGDLI